VKQMALDTTTKETRTTTELSEIEGKESRPNPGGSLVYTTYRDLKTGVFYWLFDHHRRTFFFASCDELRR